MNSKLFILATTLGALGQSINHLDEFKKILLVNLTTEEVQILEDKLKTFAKTHNAPSDEEINKGFADFAKSIIYDKE